MIPRKKRKQLEALGLFDSSKVIVHKKRTKGLWFNDVTGNFHQTLMVEITRKDGSVDRGLPDIPGGLVPKHPTTGNPLWTPGPTIYDGYRPIHDRAPDHLMGLQINPEPSGTLNRGTVYVRVKGVLRNATALAWEKQTSEQLPKGARIRHIDGNPWNNHIDNLERVGVGTGGAYQAATRIGGVRVALGSYKTREEAVEAVRAFRASVGAGPVRAYRRKTVTGADHPATL